MKLLTRKTIAAFGTAVAVTLAPVTAVTTAPVAVAAEADYSAEYNTTYDSAVELRAEGLSDFEIADKTVNATIAIVEKDRTKYNVALSTILKGRQELDEAEKLLDKSLPTKESNPSRADLDSIKSLRNGYRSALTKIKRAESFNATANTEIKNANGQEFVCETETESDGSSIGSSGKEVVIDKNGKKKCVSKWESMSEQLTKVVAVLGTIFTLVTTLSKIANQFQKMGTL